MMQADQMSTRTSLDSYSIQQKGVITMAKKAASKATKTDAEKKAEAKAAKQAEEKKLREEEREAKKAAKEEAKAAERQEAIDSGALIEDGDFEFHKVDREDRQTVEERAATVVERLKESKVPVVGKELMEELGGGWPQYLSFFSLLKVQGLVIEYRRRGGERGTSGVAYLWHENA